MQLFYNKNIQAVAFWTWIVVIIIGCSLPGSEVPKVSVFKHFDKLVHFTFYFILCVLGFIYKGIIPGTVLALMFFVIIFSFAIEYYQLYFIKGRSFDVYDGIAGIIGAFCSLVLRKSIAKIWWQ